MDNWKPAEGAYPDSPRMELQNSAYYCERCQVTHSGLFVQRMGRRERRYYAYSGPHMLGVADSFEGAREVLGV